MLSKDYYFSLNWHWPLLRQKIHLIICSVTIFLNLFYYSGNLLNTNIVSKEISLYCTSIIIFAAAIYTCVKLRLDIKFHWIDLLVLLFLVAPSIISYYVQENDSVKSLQSFVICIIFFLLRVICGGNDRSDFLKIFAAVLTGSVVVEIILIISQYFGWFNLTYSGHELTGSFTNPAHLAIYLTGCALFILDRILSFWIKIRYFRKLDAILFVACTTIIIISLSRTAWFAYLSVALAMLIVYSFRGLNWKTIIMVVVTVATFCMITIPIVINLKKKSALGRTLSWDVTLDIIKENPIIGVGEGLFPVSYLKYQGRYFKNAIQKERFIDIAGDVRYAFNDFLQIAAEKGILALLIFIIIIGYSAYNIVSKKNKTDSILVTEFGLLVFNSVILMAGFFSYPQQVVPINLMFWVIIALLAQPSSPETKSKTLNPKIYGLLLFCISLGFISAIYFTWKKYRIYKSWNTVRAKPNYQELTSSKYETYLGNNADYLFDVAKIYEQEDSLQLSLNYLEKAKKYAPNKELYYLSGSIYERMRDYDKAEQQYDFIAQARPNLLKPIYLKALLAYKIDRENFKLLAKQIEIFKPKIDNIDVTEMKLDIQIKLLNMR